MQLGDVANEIRAWASERGITDPVQGSSPRDQLVKLMEEVGEIAGALTRCRANDVLDGIGDAFVVLTILAELCDSSLEECAQAALQVIKHRKGKMVAGVFVKEEDLA